MKTRFYFNHIGIEEGSSACALFNLSDWDATPVEVVNTATGRTVSQLTPAEGQISFRELKLGALDLSELQAGRYTLRYGEENSPPFAIGKHILVKSTLSLVLDYFKSQRCSSPWDDKSVSFFGSREGSVDVHGGWYDASGDVSKYLSHLSYANFMNPQQTPMALWALLEHLEKRAHCHEAGIFERLRDEANHGAQFLCRMQDPAGYFYTTVFDQWSKDPSRRLICAYKTQSGERLESYQAGMRQGGGMAVAALARAGRVLGNQAYVDAAAKGWAHLEQYGLSYLDDGKENIIDDYCALMAATELLDATSDKTYLQPLRKRAAQLMNRRVQTGPVGGWLRADDLDRPYFHAAEAGLPIIALMNAAKVDKERASVYQNASEDLMVYELAITGEKTNAFGYARQYTQDIHGKKETRFFIPHDNETGYWWQGENARLGSLAAAAGIVAAHTTNRTLKESLKSYAMNQLDWICGKNPFDSCMIHGFGRNNGNYMKEWPNVLGGITNGITSGYEDESDVDYGRNDLDGDNSWRWHEQWMPHAAWFLIALGELFPE